MGQAAQLRITLADIEPAIWRSVLVADAITLLGLHRTIQAAFGWQDCHLHRFEIDRIRYETPHPDFPWDPPTPGWLDHLRAQGVDEADITYLITPPRDERRVRLSGFVNAGIGSFEYVYDFGDDWAHRIDVEEVMEADAHGLPLLVGGQRACPPEDCGGLPGYLELIEAVRNPTAESENREWREWLLRMVGPQWDPDRFDAPAAAVRLDALRPHRGGH